MGRSSQTRALAPILSAGLLAGALTPGSALAQDRESSVPEAEVALPPSEGQRFPLLQFPLLGEEDRLASLADWHGKKILLFQFASW